MTDQSGDRDFVIHGSAPFLGACQEAVSQTKTMLHSFLICFILLLMYRSPSLVFCFIGAAKNKLSPMTM